MSGLPNRMTDTVAYLNGQFLPLTEARISPLDRGFLFGDGIYEVIPSYQGNTVGLALHLARLDQGLAAIGITNPLDQAQWQQLVQQLISHNLPLVSDNAGLGIYLQVSRGADSKRGHAFPADVRPTVFGFAFAIAAPPTGDLATAKGVAVYAQTDQRWRRCHLKSTALLGNVLHHQAGVEQGFYETLLFNQQDQLTEGSSCNVFVVHQGVVATPPLDQQILPGITRHILLQLLRQAGCVVQERVISRAEVLNADEVWLTSSSKELVPVVQIEQHLIGSGAPGPVWAMAQQLFARHRFDSF